MTHPTLGPSPHAHSENLVLQSCSSSPVSSTEKVTWSTAKTTLNTLAVSWCWKMGVPCLWMILKGKLPLSTYYNQNLVNLFKILPFLTSSCHISSTHPSQVQGQLEMTHTPIWMSGTVTHVQPDNNSVKCWAANVTRVSEIKVSNLAVVIDVECQTHTTTVLVLVSSCQVSLILCLIQFCDSEFSSVVVPCYI